MLILMIYLMDIL